MPTAIIDGIATRYEVFGDNVPKHVMKFLA